MTWKNTIIAFLACLVALSSYAQDAPAQRERTQPDRRFMAELSSVFLDYQGLQNGQIFQANQFIPGITMGAHAMLNRYFNLSSGVSFAPELRYPLEQDRMVTTSLIDVNVLTRFKFSGLYNRPDALFAPFVATGVGINSASNNLRFYLPMSLGLKLQLQENFAIMMQSTYKQGFGPNNIQHLAHTVGFVFGIPGTEIPNPVPPPSHPNKDSLLLASMYDEDGDGVPDRDDLCPGKPGRAMYLGCPIDDTPPEDTLPMDTLPSEEGPIVEATPQQPEGFELPEDAMELPNIEAESFDTPKEEAEAPQPEAVEFQRISAADIDIVRRAVDKIYFEPGSSQLTGESRQLLDQVANVLRRNPAYHLDVRGYADQVNDPDPTNVLPVTRAFAVKRYLCYEQDIAYARVYSDGKLSRDHPMGDFGGTRPNNRRVELDLIAPDHMGYRGGED